MNRIQGSSHSRLTSPRTTKNIRQPTLASNAPPINVPRAGPSLEAASSMALAMPRRSDGMALAKIRE
jgi:hypothetical protein